MTASIESPGPSIEEADILKLEASLGQSLPDDYRRFLAEHNGGIPTPFMVTVGKALSTSVEAGVGAPGEQTDVSVLFGIGRPTESSNLDWNLSTLRERLDNLPEQLLPIASDSGGNVFCLTLDGEATGSILYCDLESVFADYGAIPGLYNVAKNFDGFLSILEDE